MSVSELIEMEKEVLRQEYELKLKELEDQLEYGAVGDMKWLKERLNIKSIQVIKERVLYPFREELEGDVVYYADRPGNPFRINKALFNKWMVENFSRVDWGK